ncbi:MAG: UvrD-helicase domain-containing protein [Anaerolineae bacterium]|nr:UvrD-helicase domain-containing protein [Anaerolineae bacterium]
MDLLLDVLNPAQREAVQAGEGPVLVLAGPGSGKTRVLTHRVAYLVGRQGIPPYRIMAVTFTNKAAHEMKARLESLLGAADLRDLTIGTFHATCARILRRDGEAIGIDGRFLIFDTGDQENLVKKVLADLRLDHKEYRPAAVLNVISRWKNELLTPERTRPASYREEVIKRIYERYQQLLREANALDFDDLLTEAVRLFRECPEVLARYRRRYSGVLVDEFQDTNLAQYEIVRLLAQEARHLFVVGDEDQSIYGWRGADFRNVQRFRKDFPEARLILLEQNYRSTQNILDAARSVIRHNLQRTDKRLWTENPRGQPIIVYEAYDEHEEAQFVVDEIQRLAARGVCRLGECAVMYRTNAQSRVLEDEFVRRGVPYRIVGATRFYGRKEVKDVLSYLRLIHNPHDGASMARVLNVPPRGIGSKTVSALEAWATRQNLSWFEVLRRLAADEHALPVEGRSRRALIDFYQIIEGLRDLSQKADLLTLFDQTLARTGYQALIRDGTEEGEDRWQNIQELRSVAREYAWLPPGEGLTEFLTNVALVSDVDTLREEADAPTLLTLHAAKGLEFATVFVVGMEEGLLPHSRSLGDRDQMEEERRLCYVGMTRAKQWLYLTYTFRRTIFGDQELSEVSRFLHDIPPQIMRAAGSKGPARLLSLRERPAAPMADVRSPRPALASRRSEPESVVSSPRQRPRAEPPVEQRFAAGDWVRHPTFGKGRVISSAVRGGDEEVTVAFDGLGIKRLMVSYARLEKLA